VPFTLIISMLVLAGLGAALFVFYQSGVRRAGQPPQAVGQPVAGIKAPPPAEGQPQDPAAGLQIYKTEDGKAPAEGQPNFTPAPEQPQARPQAAPAPAVVVTPPTALPPAQPAPTLRPAIPAQPPAAAAPPPAAAPPAATPAPAPKAVTPPPAATKPAAPKMAAPKPAEVKPTAEKPAKTAPEPAPKPVAKSTGGAFVQIGAVSSTALADKAWSDAAAIAPGLAAGKGKNVEKVDKDGKSLFRVQVTGFASHADAQAFCDKLKAAGKACFAR
jgi:hypothetical protein